MHGGDIKLYACYTPSHKVLYNDWFLPSLMAFNEYDLIVETYDQECEKAEFLSEGWTKTTSRKVQLILRAIKENWGSWFVYSDVDIQFFRPTLGEITKAIGTKDIVFQQNDPARGFCTGFFACRANERTLEFWLAVADYMHKHSDISDQASVWNIYKIYKKSQILHVKCGLLPNTFFCAGTFRGCLWNPEETLEIPKGIIIHHANYTHGVPNKIAQLKLVKNMVDRGL